jgi:gliding motility-associated-like protein
VNTIYRDTLKNISGCDSLLRITTVNVGATPSSQTQNVAICVGKTYTLPNGRVVNIATNFKDTLKNRYGCDSLIRVVNLSINPLPIPDVRDVTICPNETATLQVRNTPNNYRSFQWQNNVSTTATANYTPPLSGTYKVTVTDINGCEGIATANITVKSANDTSCITVIPKPKTVNDDIILELNQTKINFNVTTNDIFDRNLNWKVSIKERPTQGTLMDLGKGAFLYEATPNQRGLVFVKYLLCTTFRAVDYCDSAIVTINILGRDRKLPPDAITPNGDGKNDRFIIPDLDENPTKYPNNELIILNRWGQVLYQAKPYKNDWEGTNQQNLPLPDGTYYYIMRLSIADGKILTGDLLIVRD